MFTVVYNCGLFACISEMARNDLLKFQLYCSMKIHPKC